jgi:hypothetical protein
VGRRRTQVEQKLRPLVQLTELTGRSVVVGVLEAGAAVNRCGTAAILGEDRLEEDAAEEAKKELVPSRKEEGGAEGHTCAASRT